MELLYPISRQFPFDETCEQIVREMEVRNWEIPDIEVRFGDYGTGDQKYCYVSEIHGLDFRIHFGRKQRPLAGGRWNDIAAVTQIIIPRMDLAIFEDESGPTFNLYVGDDYGKDREKFLDSIKTNSKLWGEPKTYLLYKGGCDCGKTGGASFGAIGYLTAMLNGDADAISRMYHTHAGRRSPFLVHNNDLGREYDPTLFEPRRFKTSTVFTQFRIFLEDAVLAKIIAEPIPETRVNILAQPEPLPFPESIGPIFCFGVWDDADRIATGKKDPQKLKPADRYAFSGSGYRLMPLGARKSDGSIPKIAFDGFLWCGLGKVSRGTDPKTLRIADNAFMRSSECYLFRVIPNRANGVFVADHSCFEKRRKELADDLGDRTSFTDEEVDDFKRARARTIVPVAEYQGGYEDPIILINRELGLDEVEIVSSFDILP